MASLALRSDFRSNAAMMRFVFSMSICVAGLACSSRAPSTNANAVEPRDRSSGQESAAVANVPTPERPEIASPLPSGAQPVAAPATPPAAARGRIVVDHRNADPASIPAQYLDAVRQLDIFWGRQSVGGNIVQGLELLSSQNASRYALALQYLNPAETGVYGVRDLLGVFELGINGQPSSKTEAFRRDIAERGFGERVDVAMMKFCYVDFGEGLDDPNRTFENYRTAMETLERAYPQVRFVWWTAPIMTTGLAARDTFNAKVRAYTAANSKILFDIADIESHNPQGAPVRRSGLEAMHPAYSVDGGHLSEEGQRRAAGAFWVLMARIAGWPG